MTNRAADELTLFTPYFWSGRVERQAEFEKCLRRNLGCSAIARIYLLIDDGHVPPVKHDKIKILRLEGRPTYRRWLELASREAGAGISILANTDIYFDDSVAQLHAVLEQPKSFLALSRWDLNGESIVAHAQPQWSQDAWAIKLPTSVPASLHRELDVPLGVPRCDNKIAYLFAVHGWKLFNPCRYVRSVHVHETQLRTYDKKADASIMGGVAYVHPGRSLSDPSDVEIDIWAAGTHQIKKVALNQRLDAWARMAGTPVKVDEKTFHMAESAPPAPVSGADKSSFLRQGTLLYDHRRRFRVYRLNDDLLYLDALNPRAVTRVLSNDATEADDADRKRVEIFLPPVIDTYPIVINERPTSPDDCLFWQYPCGTERQALANHLMLESGANIDDRHGQIHCYLGLPWATCVDKKSFPKDVTTIARSRIAGMKSLAAAHDYDLAVHTVCQTIHWRRLIDQFSELGVTDLHLSHCEWDLGALPFRLHSWPLIAVNVEDPTRSAGLVFGKPLAEKRYLASFIGAHMPHYRSDVRLRLLAAAKADGGDDLLVDLGREWHFNRIVYGEQVRNQAIEAETQEKHTAATRRYNEVLSDSVFSLCPEGAGPNTLRLWESLAAGAIPVVLADAWVPPDLPGYDQTMEDACLFISQGSMADLFSTLRAIDPGQIAEMQRACFEVYRLMRRRTTY